MNLAARARSVPAMTGLDPFRAQSRLAWRNRLARWRREGAQTGVHAAALGGLAVLLGVPAWQARATWGGAIADALRQWPGATLAAATLVMATSFAATLRGLRTSARGDWLAALPVAPRLRSRRLRDAAMREASGFAALGTMLLVAAHASMPAFASFALALAAAMSLAWLATRSRFPMHAHSPAVHLIERGVFGSPKQELHGRFSASLVIDRGAGRLWRWQKLACGVALRGRTLAWGGLAWLAVPMGSGLGTVMTVGVAGLLLALMTGAWRRTLGVLPQAQAWLAPQPLAPARLLSGTAAVPMLVLAIAVASASGVLFALGTSALALFAALGMIASGVLQFGAVAAERAHPKRAPLVFLVHAVLLLGVLQAFPVAAMPLWAMQVTMLLRQALR